MKRIISIAICAAICLSLFAMSITQADAADFYSQAELLTIKEHIEDDAGLGSYATVQGACSDGRYAYFAAQFGATTLLKYDMKSWELVKKKSGIVTLGHANDIAYNSKEKFLVVANNGPDYDVVSIVDPDTLKVTGTAKLKLKIYSIAYNADRDIYIVGISGSYNFAFLDKDFKVLKKYKGVKTGYTRQGGDCDSQYIYFTQSDGSNLIVIYDYDGKYVDTVSIGHSHEVENLFHSGSAFYTTLHYYGNSVHRIGFSDATQIRFTVKYDPGTGYGEMKNTSVHYGTETALSECTYEREGYFFGGWRAQRSQDDRCLGYRTSSKEIEWLDESDVNRYFLYDDGAKVSQTIRFGSVTMTAFWINEYYPVYYEAEYATGWMESAYLAYDETYTIPENQFEKEGFVFVGYTAYRTADDKYYGYAKDSDEPEWLSIGDLYTDYLFKPGDDVSRLTYDGAVTMSAEFRYAYTFSSDNSALIQYIGVDETALIPDQEGALTTIASAAFNGNEPLKTIVVPSTVTTMESAAVRDCPNLTQVHFSESFPADFSSDAFVGCRNLLFEQTAGEKWYFLGIYADRSGDGEEVGAPNATATFIRNNAKNYARYLSRGAE